MSDNVAPKYPIQSLEKAIQVLQYMQNSSDPDGLTLSEVSKGLELSKSTTHRILDTLLYYSFVEKTNDPICKYRLGWGLYRAGHEIPALHPLEASDYKNQISLLANDLKLPVGLYIVRNNYSVPLFETASRSNTYDSNLYKNHFPLYASATGKLFLSNYTEDELIKYFQETDIRKYSAATILNYIDFLDELNLIKKNKYAIDNGEYDKDEYNLAMPVKDYTKRTVAAVNICTRYPFTRNIILEIQPHLEKCCSKLSAFMGYFE